MHAWPFSDVRISQKFCQMITKKTLITNKTDGSFLFFFFFSNRYVTQNKFWIILFLLILNASQHFQDSFMQLIKIIFYMLSSKLNSYSHMA